MGGVSRRESEIYGKHSFDGVATWSLDQRLTIESDISFSRNVWAFVSSVHVAWYDVRDGNAEIDHKRSLDGGVSWGPDARLSNNPTGSFQPSISATSRYVHVAWHHTRDGNREIDYKRN